jgi:cysteine desulfurase
MRFYFDYAASAPPFAEAISKWQTVASEHFGNPSSAHEAGKSAAALLGRCRRDFCSLAGFENGERLVFTSSGTEANNMVIRGIMDRNPGGRMAIAADTHASAWFATEAYSRRVDIIPIDNDGRLSPAALEKCLSKRTILCSVVHGNNENGVVHDIKEIGRICAERGVAVHVDGVQTLGHLPLALRDLPFDFFSFSAHKFGGLRGAGGLFYRGNGIRPLISGGPQESGLRAGTENVAAVAGSLEALRASVDSIASELPRMRELAKRVQEALARRVKGVVLNSRPAEGLPGLISASFPGTLGKNLVIDLSLQGFEVSAGSACHSGNMEPSRTILAMGRSRDTALGTIRVSMGRMTDSGSAEALVDAVAKAVERQSRHGK